MRTLVTATDLRAALHNDVCGSCGPTEPLTWIGCPDHRPDLAALKALRALKRAMNVREYLRDTEDLLDHLTGDTT